MAVSVTNRNIKSNPDFVGVFIMFLFEKFSLFLRKNRIFLGAMTGRKQRSFSGILLKQE